MSPKKNKPTGIKAKPGTKAYNNQYYQKIRAKRDGRKPNIRSKRRRG